MQDFDCTLPHPRMSGFSAFWLLILSLSQKSLGVNMAASRFEKGSAIGDDDKHRNFSYMSHTDLGWDIEVLDSVGNHMLRDYPQPH